MQASVERKTAVALLMVEHDSVRYLIDTLTDEEMLYPNTIEYGLYWDQQCSFKDLLAHLICYEAYAIEALGAWLAGKPHWISAAMRSPQKSMEIHYGGIAERSHLSLQEVLDEWEETQSTLMERIGQLTDDQWYQPAPFAMDYRHNLGGMLEEILVAPPRPMYRHLPVHIPDSEAYVRGFRR